MARQQRRQFGQGNGGEISLVRRQGQAGVGPDLVQFAPQGLFIQLIWLVIAHGLRRSDDGSIAGATTQVAGQRVVNRGAIGAGIVSVQGEQGHDKTWRAKAALGAVAIHHSLLRRVQAALVEPLQALHRVQGLAVQGGQKAYAGIDGAKAHPVRVRLGDDDGACAAISFGASFFSADALQLFPQVIQHGGGWFNLRGFMDAAIQEETDGALARLFSLRRGHGGAPN